jgi:hypothetical protein
VLVIVIAVQFGSGLGAGQPGETDPDHESESPGPAAHPVGQSSSADDRDADGRDESCLWPKLELADVRAYDPFAVAPTVANSAETPTTTVENKADRARQEHTLEQLREQGVQAVIGGSLRGNAAVVGSETVRVGDVLAATCWPGSASSALRPTASCWNDRLRSSRNTPRAGVRVRDTPRADCEGNQE